MWHRITRSSLNYQISLHHFYLFCSIVSFNIFLFLQHFHWEKNAHTQNDYYKRKKKLLHTQRMKTTNTFYWMAAGCKTSISTVHFKQNPSKEKKKNTNAIINVGKSLLFRYFFLFHRHHQHIPFNQNHSHAFILISYHIVRDACIRQFSLFSPQKEPKTGREREGKWNPKKKWNEKWIATIEGKEKYFK